jgi:ribosomal protein S2
MAADIVNLRQVRKSRARVEKEKTAEANRRLHGMTKAERDKAADARDRLERHVEGHRRKTDGDKR